MWCASIKVSVGLMLLPASWHSMTIWKRGGFLYPWQSAPVERGAKEPRIGSGKREAGGKKKYIQISNPIYMWLCLNATLLRGVQTGHQRRALIEAQQKHANALILFSLPALPQPSLIFVFSKYTSDHSSQTFTTRVPVCRRLHAHLPLSDRQVGSMGAGRQPRAVSFCQESHCTFGPRFLPVELEVEVSSRGGALGNSVGKKTAPN